MDWLRFIEGWTMMLKTAHGYSDHFYFDVSVTHSLLTQRWLHDAVSAITLSAALLSCSSVHETQVMGERWTD